MHRLANWQLFAICVLVWGTTWYAITFQVANFPPEVGVALLFSPEFAAATGSGDTALGVTFVAADVLSVSQPGRRH